MNRKRKIFVGPWETAGYYKGLTQGLIELGEEVTFVLFHDHPFAYGGETEFPFLIRFAKAVARKRPEKQDHLRFQAIWWLLTFFREVLLMAWSIVPILRCNVFLFGTGNSFWRRNLDLWLLKILRKKVVLNVGHGGELRPPYMDGSYQSKDGSFDPSLAYYVKLAAKYQRKILRIERFGFVVIGSPMSSAQFASKEMVNWFNIGIPTHLQSQTDRGHKYAEHPQGPRPLRVLHAPSHPAAKGTPKVRSVMSELIDEGLKIDYREIVGEPFEAVRNALLWCDFVVDQVYSDQPLAGFASEAALFGKPSVVGGYGIERLMRNFPEINIAGFVVSRPEEIKTSVRKLVLDKTFRLKLGQEAREFVSTNWSSVAVAKRFLMLIEGSAPSSWNFHPDNFPYFEGYGQEVHKTKQRIRHLVERYGIQSLQLDHKQTMRDQLLKWAFEVPKGRI